jgi:hypothetical protein
VTRAATRSPFLLPLLPGRLSQLDQHDFRTSLSPTPIPEPVHGTGFAVQEKRALARDKHADVGRPLLPIIYGDETDSIWISLASLRAI